MTVAAPADPRDVQDFQFKLHCRLRIFTGQDETFTSSVNLVVPASKYGLIFVGCRTGLQVITSSTISGLDHRGAEINNYSRRELQLPSRPTHLGVSCDHNYLMVAITKDGCVHGLIYSVPSFTSKNVALVSEIRLSSKPDTSILELTWNPGIANILAACLGDGSLAAYELKPSGLDISTQPPATQATCFCWSPKGKQLVVGTEAGTLTQYKPDLKAVKTIPAPGVGSGSVAVVNVLWISNYQFAAIYRDRINTDERPGLLIVNAPKTGTVTFVNYEDICYSAGELRSPQFYLIHQPAWNILMVASANSMEVGVLGLREDQISWEQWTQEDAARAELPLSSNKQETFPIGMGLDTSTQNELPWGENQSLPPMPVLHILSHQGVLCMFHAVNLKPEAARICSPPEIMPDESGLAFFTTGPSSPAETPQATPIQMGRLQTSTDEGLGGLRINPASKFGGISVPQPPASSIAAAPSLFGQSLAGAPVPPFGSGFTAPTLSFGSGLASTTSAAAPTAPSIFAQGLLGSEKTGFGTAVTGFGSAPSYPPPSTTTSAPAMTFGAGMANPPSISFGTGLSNLTGGLGSGQTNPPPIKFGTTLGFSSSSTPASKPTSSFQAAVVSTTPSVASPVPNSKPSTVQSGASFSFVTPSSTSTPQSMKQNQHLQTSGAAKTPISFFSSGTSSQPPGGAVNLIKIPAKVDVPSLEVRQSQAKPVALPAVSAPSKPAAISAVNNTVLLGAIKEEITHFERELAELRSRVNAVEVEVGTEKEKEMLCQKVDSIDEFWSELEETTQAQSSEIHNLKSELLESFAWTEEAKSRSHQLNNPMYLQLTRSQTLDPITARYASNMKHLVYYVENQLRQVNQQLDSNWLEFQDSCKPPIKNKMHIPTLEAVYQAMVMQNSILNKQRVIMADILRRVQEQGTSTQIPLISTAVLARVRDKEASHLGKGETELSRLAENLVQLKLGPPSMHITPTCRRLSRKKELLLRELLSQRTVTRICSTKPLQSTLGSISSGKPIITKFDTPSDTAITETKISAVGKPEFSQTPFTFDISKTANQFDGGSKGLGSQGTSLISGKTSGPTIATTVVVPNGLTIGTNKAKPNVMDNPSVSKVTTNANDVPAGIFTFSSPLQSGKTTVPENFSFATGLNKVASDGKLSGASRKLEDYYEELTPPGTPEHSLRESASTPVVSVPTMPFTFSFTPSAKPNILPPVSVGNTGLSPLRSPLSSLDNIVAGIGDGNISIKSVSKPANTKSSPVLSQAASTGAFSFGSISLGQPQQPGKADEIKKPSDTFKFSLNTAPTTLPTGSGDITQVIPLKVPVATTTTGISLKTPLFTYFETENQQNATPKVNIFGGGEGLKSTGSSASSSSSGNMFAQAFGGNSTGSPAKQALSSGNIFGAPIPAPSFVFGKQNRDTTATATTTVTTETEQKISKSPQKEKIPASSSSDNLFSQSTSLFGSLSMGTPSSSTKPVGNIFGGSSTTFSFGKQSSENQTPNFSFGKQPTPSANRTANFSFGKQPTVTENQANPIASSTLETAETPVQKSESPTKDTQPSGFDQPSSTTGDEKGETSGASSDQSTLSTSTVLSGGKVESTTGNTFSFGQSPATAESTVVSQAASIFGQASDAAKTTGSVFGTTATIAPTTQPTTQPITSSALTSAATQTSSTTSSTFTFSLPASTQSLSLFTQKTSVFGQPDSAASTTATTTSNSSTFFGQPICSPSVFGQSGGSIFGQTATTAVKTNIFGQSETTTSAPPVFGLATTVANTSPSIFGQSSSTPIFGQASTGSSFLGGSTGGFGSKPTFVQSGASIFEQNARSSFGSSGGSIFGGGGTAGSSMFGGGTASSGNLFQSSSGGSIFGGSSLNSGASTGGAFSGGMGQTISQSGFGSPTAFQSKPGGFGGSPVFDRGASGFGSPPTFGGAPTFGGSPTFGSPGNVFGSTSPASNISFGSTGQQQSNTFESLANQNTMTFGNIAQNPGQGFGSPPQPVFGGSPQPQPSAAPAFSSNNAFGGSSFSSWR